MTADWLPGVHTAPNIQGDPAIYEIENRAIDPEGSILAAMARVAPWQGRIVLDLGAGTGFYIPVFHDAAQHVFAVEPHGPSRRLAMSRVASLGLDRASVMTGSAERILLPDDSVDVVHARFAYFWGPGCEPGLAEVDRVLRPGGSVVIIDNDLDEGTFADWLARAPGSRDQATIRAFWRDQGFLSERIPSCWRFRTRADLEAVVRLEFRELAEELLREHRGVEVDYTYRLYHRDKAH